LREFTLIRLEPIPASQAKMIVFTCAAGIDCDIDPLLLEILADAIG
jgi:hypothetical protein